MFRSAVSKVMWVGRATVFLVGLAVILALLFGVASMAFARDGQSFILGQRNVAQSLSTLVKQGAGPALSLRVDSGAPLAVNSDTRVANLNADQLDGVDSAGLLRNSIYEESRETTGASATGGGAPNETASAFIFCDLGDTVLGGGFDKMDNGTHLVASRTTPALGGHNVKWRNNHTVDTVEITAICADMTP
jgi:hypothetical protein